MKRPIALTLLVILASDGRAQTPVTWATPTTGALGPHTVGLTGMVSPFLRTANFLNGNYTAAPMPANVGLDHFSSDQWTATFSPPMSGLLWYGQNIRGISGSSSGLPTDYTFSQPFEILSGFSQATVVGNTLSLPTDDLHNGVIRFFGPVASLACTTTCTESNGQHCQLGQVDFDLGTAYCVPTVANSTGQVTELGSMGSDLVADNLFRLIGSSLPPGSTGLFLASRAQGFVSMPAGSEGNLCLGGQIGRFTLPGQIRTADAGGVIELQLDLTGLPTPTNFVQVAAGEQWNFQLWHRDFVQGAQTSNFSGGLEVTFL